MSTDQVSNPCAANQSITDDPGRPGTCRSKVGCDAMDEPCTNRMVPTFSAAADRFSHRNSRTGPLLVQCSSPWTWMFDSGLFIPKLHRLEERYRKRLGGTRCTARRRL